MKRIVIVLIGLMFLVGAFAETSISGSASYGGMSDLSVTYKDKIKLATLMESGPFAVDTTVLVQPELVMDDLIISMTIAPLKVSIDTLSPKIKGVLTVGDFALEYAHKLDPQTYGNYFGITGSFPFVTALVYLDRDGKKDWNGLLGTEIDFSVGDFSAGVDAEYNIDVQPLEKELSYAFDAYYTIAPIGVGFGGKVKGNDIDGIGSLIGVYADVVDRAGVACYVTREKGETVGTDLSIYGKHEGATVRVGYLITEKGLGDEEAPVALPEGGAYVNVKIPW
jgi:hypothetical protein